MGLICGVRLHNGIELPEAYLSLGGQVTGSAKGGWNAPVRFYKNREARETNRAWIDERGLSAGAPGGGMHGPMGGSMPEALGGEEAKPAIDTLDQAIRAFLERRGRDSGDASMPVSGDLAETIKAFIASEEMAKYRAGSGTSPYDALFLRLAQVYPKAERCD